MKPGNDKGYVDAIFIVVPARKTPWLYIVAPFFCAFGVGASYSLIRVMMITPVAPWRFLIFGPILFIFLYFFVIAPTLALLWSLIGKDIITIDPSGIKVERTLIIKFSNQYYGRENIHGIYLDKEDYKVNRINRGFNDFLSVFRRGTLHFTYEGKLLHFAGGLSQDAVDTMLDMFKVLGYDIK